MQQLRVGFLLFFSFCCFFIRAQSVPYLEKKVSLNKSNQSLSAVLKDLSTQTGVIFSYTPAQLNDQRKVSINVYKTALRLVLDDLLKGTKCSYKSKKNYIIISFDPKMKETPAQVVLSGYIYNSLDSSLIGNASVYITSGRHSAISDSYGYFTVSYPKQQNLISLSVAKENYLDTTLILLNPSGQKMKIYLIPKVQTIIRDTLVKSFAADSIVPAIPDTTVANKDNNRFINFWLRLKQMRSNFRNINDTLFSNYSFSLFPPISTNKLLSINTVNKFSFNLLVGHSKGIRYFELGGLLNIDNGKVSYVQIAGLGNVVADTTCGVQVAGLFNKVNIHVVGTQIGGVFNTTRTVKGAQVAGIFNRSVGVEGAQIGGIFNTSRTVKGAQVAGIYNRSSGVEGTQIAGIANTGKNVSGFQLAGIINKVDTVKGMQLAGIVNKAGNCEGVQLAGVYNYARKMKGFQLALVNVSDSCNGIPLGIFSYVKSGYHKLDVSGNELQFVNLGFSTGVEKLHNIFFSGINYFAEEKMWTYGYGLGSTFNLKNRWNLTTELSAQQIQPLNGAGVRLSLLNKAFVGVDFRCTRKFRVALGPSFNVLVSETDSPYYNSVSKLISPFAFYSHAEAGSNINIRMWVGGTLSFKFL